MKDAFGKELEVGSIVTYAIVHNRTARLRFGVVTKITGGNDKRVSVKGYSKNFQHNEEETGENYRWEEFRPTSCAWSSTKMAIIDLRTLPRDLQEFIKEDLKTIY